MKHISTLILFILLIPSIVCASGISQQDNYCDDQASWQQWEELLTDNPMDTGITTLYALRIGLCSMVKSGQIETQRAVKLFEEMRDAVINSINASEDADKQSNRINI